MLLQEVHFVALAGVRANNLLHLVLGILPGQLPFFIILLLLL